MKFRRFSREAGAILLLAALMGYGAWQMVVCGQALWRLFGEVSLAFVPFVVLYNIAAAGALWRAWVDRR